MPALDGVRAMAVLGVVLAHFGVGAVRGGVLGVDLFFVLSGFLITSIIAPQQQRGSFTPEFYWRRFVRLFPALGVMCLVFGVLGPLLLSRQIVLSDIAASLLYVSNWTQAFTDGTPTYLGHTWSLASEELFYLVWPAFLGLLLRLGSARKAAVVTAVLCVAVVVWRLRLAALAGYDRVYFGFDTRADSLLIGCTLALVRGERWYGRLSHLGSRSLPAAVVAVGILFAGSPWSPQIALPAALLAGWLVTGASRPGATVAHVLLGHPVVTYVGRISYSLYLWHFLVYQVLHLALGWQFLPSLLVGVPVSFLCAAASYHLVEQPFRRLRDRPARINRIRLGILCFVGPVLAMGLGLVVFQGQDILDRVQGQPFAIGFYGPDTALRGTPFNVQADGRSALWVSTTKRPPPGATVRFDGVPVTAYPVPTGFAVLLAPERLATAGRKTVEIVDADGRPLCEAVVVTVVDPSADPGR